MAHVNCDLASDLVRFLTTGDTEFSVDAQRKGLLCPDKDGTLKLTTKGLAFVHKWSPDYTASK